MPELAKEWRLYPPCGTGHPDRVALSALLPAAMSSFGDRKKSAAPAKVSGSGRYNERQPPTDCRHAFEQVRPPCADRRTEYHVRRGRRPARTVSWFGRCIAPGECRQCTLGDFSIYHAVRNDRGGRATAYCHSQPPAGAVFGSKTGQFFCRQRHPAQHRIFLRAMASHRAARSSGDHRYHLPEGLHQPDFSSA